MVAAYGNDNIGRRNVIKEILQELILAALSKSDFFSKAAFNGGTALRIFHGLDRFSEDLDFSLIRPDPDFHLSDYLPGIHKFLASYGIKAELKEKSRSGTVKAAIMSGELSAGEALPSVRAMAKSLHISILTVQKAYGCLQDDGFIEITAGKGCYVSAQNQDFYLEEQQKRIEEKFAEAIEIARTSGISLDKLTELLTLMYQEDE